MANFSLNKLPWYLQIGVFVLLSAGIAGAFYYFYESKEQVELDKQAKELSEIRGRISRGQSMARQLPEFKKEIGGLEARLEALKPILPDERDVGDLLRRVQTLATQSNLQVRGFKPQAITTKEMHAEWPISLELEGSYHNLGLFLDRVSKFPRIINVSGLAIAGARTEGPSTHTIAVTCTATTFVLLDPEALAATQPKKGAKKTPKKTA